METKLKTTETQARRSSGYFARSAVLVGALAMGCGGGMREPPKMADSGPAVATQPAASTQPKQAERPQRGVEVSCGGMGTSLQAGQEVWFGFMEKQSYSIKITGIEGERVLADVMVPTGTPVTTMNLVTFALRFDSVELSREQVQRVADAMCTQVTEARRTVDSVGRMADDMARRAREAADILGRAGGPARRAEGTPAASPRPGPHGSIPAGVLSDDSAGVGMALGYGQGIGRALSVLIALRAGRTRIPEQATGFTVEGADADAYVLRVTEGEAAGARFRLDRKVDLNLEFLFEKAGFFTTPYRIDSLSAEGVARVSLDCSREAYMEIGSSEFARGQHPSCR